MEPEKIRNEFPYLKREVKGKKIIFLDSTASAQKPEVVITAMNDFYRNHYANIHRGVYKLSSEASEMYEEAHKKVGKFFNAGKAEEEIIFTKNATESINLIARGLKWKEGDEVIVSEMEHHANIVPWQMLKEDGVKLRFAPVSKSGIIDLDALEGMINGRTKLISIVHISNFLGTINPVERIGKMAKRSGVLFAVDGAQSAPHMDVDIKKLGCDFFACSTHKMCGPTGIGILYGKKEILNDMKPLLGGGDMISKVSFEGFEYNKLPWKFEAGTGNIAGGYGTGVAIDFLKKIGMKSIEKHDMELTKYAYEEMSKIENVEIYGPGIEERRSLISFNVNGMAPHEVAGLLDNRENIAVRSGFHCVEPMHRKLGLDKGSVRASFYIYNTLEEVNVFLNELKKIASVFGKK